MKKLLIVVFSILLVVLITLGSYEIVKTPQLTTKYDVSDYYKKVKEANGKYTVVFYDDNNKTIKTMSFPVEPYVRTIENNVIGVSVSVGSPANYEFFYKPKTKQFSNTFFNLTLASQGKVVYMKYKQGTKIRLIISDIFDKEVFYQEIIKDFSPTAITSNDLQKTKFIGKDKLYIEYLQGKNYTVKKGIIDLVNELDKSSWIGKYNFYEYCPPNINMNYDIKIFKESDVYYANIFINGFQTNQCVKAKVSGDNNAIKFIFDSYLPGNAYKRYKKGETLLSLKKDASKILTKWGKIGPILPKNRKTNMIYFEHT